ncbi:carbohydrate binding family 9 domain-containing protein [Flagellimonas meishanensis]|uniref:carbohydrate binding family 9 domain-containing protein n=1 Tax=Flagellimonas meishanensis TaxID=2873264 RepID=UPI001CA6CB0D|nr:carbohydrate binding family 9 domain-containing protein [[Muricauda] meishanensis]
MALKVICALFFISSLHIQAQRQITIKKIDTPITIDGILDDAVWQNLEETAPFLNQWPKDTGDAESQTKVKLAYTNDFLYVGIICFEKNNDHIVRTLKRDQADEHFGSDGIAIVLDPFNQKTNGFFFGVNAGGAQFEGLISVEGNESFINENWDNKWFSETSLGDNVWYVEMAIPFRTLRYDPTIKSWGLNFVRNDMKNNYYSSWNRVPLNLNTINLGHTGQVIWDENPPKTKKGNINLLPYVASGVNQDFQSNSGAEYNFEAGIDAKLAISPSLNLDLTINPDFSNVDVDQQITNLTRFPLFFPERRGFFLENSDLFTSFGKEEINPFFSRRIGLDNGLPVPVHYGARISGNLSNKLRMGLMDVQTGDTDDVNAQNYLVSAFSQRVGKRSTLDALFVNRQRMSNTSDSTQNAFNRVLALEYNFLDAAGKWSATMGMHRSFNPGDLDEEHYYTATVQFNNKNILTRVSGDRVGENYLTDVGFVPRLNNFDAANDTFVRLGYYQLSYLFVYNFLPKQETSKYNLHGPRVSSRVFLNTDGSLNASFAGFFYFFDFKNQNALELSYVNEKNDLPFDSFIVGSVPFSAGYYSYDRVGFWYRLDPRKKISGSLGSDYGTFYNGKGLSINAQANIRFQPWGNFGLRYDFNDIRLPENLESDQLHLFGLTSEISFSNKMFWTTFLQYNTQIDNLNLNSRFQWRFLPMSDFFAVYTENYFPENLTIKNRGLILKLTYWF